MISVSFAEKKIEIILCNLVEDIFINCLVIAVSYQLGSRKELLPSAFGLQPSEPTEMWKKQSFH